MFFTYFIMPRALPLSCHVTNRIWWLCLVPTFTTRFASDLGVQNGKQFNRVIQRKYFTNNGTTLLNIEWRTQYSLTNFETILDWMAQFGRTNCSDYSTRDLHSHQILLLFFFVFVFLLIVCDWIWIHHMILVHARERVCVPVSLYAVVGWQGPLVEQCL